MKSVGILTLHYSDNYGAVLQAFALRKVLNSFDGCVAEIINYVPSDFGYGLYDRDAGTKEKFIDKRDKFERFLQEECGISTPMCNSIPNIGYDYYVVGSDQVWNFTFTHTSNFAYLLPDVDDEIKKVSYGASIGIAPRLAEKYTDEFRRYLPKFKDISLREYTHVDFVEGITGKECECVVDPTLLLQTTDYEELITEVTHEEAPYVFLFWLNNDESIKGIEFANTIARKYELNIIHTFSREKGYMFYKSGGNVLYGGIEDFLWYIKNASFVVTNSYHGTLFSIQFEKPVYIFPVTSMKSRIDELVYQYGIGDRVVDRYIYPDEITDNMNYSEIKEKIQINREKSLKYLKKALELE